MRSSSQQSNWRNWAGNQTFTAQLVGADDEQAVAAAVRRAADAGQGIRVAGTGHSFTPVVQPRDVLLDLRGPRGILPTTPNSSQAEVYAHTSLSELGPALWENGASLRNQGDTDGQTLAGATATGTKGSGKRLRNMSAEITSMTLVDGTGTIRRLDDGTLDDLRAARIALGLLGVVTRIGINVDTAYWLRENNSSLPVDAVTAEAGDDVDRYRHYSFCWCPHEATWSRFGLPETEAGQCFVKRLSIVPGPETESVDGQEVRGTAGRRVGPSYAIYPDWGDQEPAHVELEYMVAENVWHAAFAAVRHLITTRFPEQITPVQVRWQAADDSYLSAQYGRETVSIALVADPTPAGLDFLRCVHQVLDDFDARPHWGKMHFFDHERIRAAVPALPEFLAVRERFDPAGTFLNPHLAALLLGEQ